MAMDTTTALQRGTCAIVQTKCCMFTPDESANVLSLLYHMDISECPECFDPQPRGLSKSMVKIMGLLMEKDVTTLGNYYLNLCFLFHVPVIIAVASASSATR